MPGSSQPNGLIIFATIISVFRVSLPLLEYSALSSVFSLEWQFYSTVLRYAVSNAHDRLAHYVLARDPDSILPNSAYITCTMSYVIRVDG